MPSPDDRLQELRHQRTLVQEQLAFLDREIASASGEAAPKPATQSPPVAPAADDVVALIKSYQDESESSPTKAYRGCLWIFVATIVLFALCLFAFYCYVKGHQSPPVR
jgi:hypothetical protein